MFLALQK